MNLFAQFVSRAQHYFRVGTLSQPLFCHSHPLSPTSPSHPRNPPGNWEAGRNDGGVRAGKECTSKGRHWLLWAVLLLAAAGAGEGSPGQQGSSASSEHCECPFDHICKISKYGFKTNGARRMGFIMKWPSYSRHQGIPPPGLW